jgi:hypothetical protein
MKLSKTRLSTLSHSEIFLAKAGKTNQAVSQGFGSFVYLSLLTFC